MVDGCITYTVRNTVSWRLPPYYHLQVHTLNQLIDAMESTSCILILYGLWSLFLAIVLTAIITISFFRFKFHSLRRRQHSQPPSSSSSSSSSSLTPPSSQQQPSLSVAFFHPHCRGGGGGERVLWKAIESISQLLPDCDAYDTSTNTNKKKEDEVKKGLNQKQKQNLNLRVVVYTSDPIETDYHRDVLQHVEDRFSITIPQSLQITFVHIPPMTLPSTQRFTLIMESIHSIKLAYHALCQFTPHVYIDTTGCAFTFVVAKLLANCSVIAYVHYPTISTDMLNLVWERRPTYNNTTSISRNKLYTFIKLVYYVLFAIAYGIVGSLSDIILVNSTWTYNHISYLWRYHKIFNSKKKSKIHVVYPPCDISTSDVQKDEHNNNNRDNNIVSIGQFRPEKDHAKQIQSFAKLLSKYNGTDCLPPGIKLVLIGSCRNESDYNRVKQLRTLAYDTLHLSSSQVEFIINQPYPVLQKYMTTSLIGLHTMWNEHFGISIVEMMSNGLITIGHDSGGPKSDIITIPTSQHQRTGYLAGTEEEYVEAIYDIYQLQVDEREKLRQAAKVSCERFSDDVFMHEFKFYLSGVLSKIGGIKVSKN